MEVIHKKEGLTQEQLPNQPSQSQLQIIEQEIKNLEEQNFKSGYYSDNSSSDIGSDDDSGGFEDDTEPEYAYNNEQNDIDDNISQGNDEIMNGNGLTKSQNAIQKQSATGSLNSRKSSAKEEQAQNDSQELKKQIQSQIPQVQPLIGSGYSLKPDMMFGWKPKITPAPGAPIPLYFDYEEPDAPKDKYSGEYLPIIYYGYRPKDTLVMHREFTNGDNYFFKFPSQLTELVPLKKRKRPEIPRQFIGMNPQMTDENLIFDSKFECGNLDMVAKVNEKEFDMYMRVDANTRGHHQWFYFSVENKQTQKVRFNIVNFTKPYSLYNQGMRINVHSQNKQLSGAQCYDEATGWDKQGDNIKYKLSKITKEPPPGATEQQIKKIKRYYCLQFEYEFTSKNDKTYFSFCYPYTYSRAYKLVRSLVDIDDPHRSFPLPPASGTKANPLTKDFIKETVLCKSLSGIDIPLLTITSRVHHDSFHEISLPEFEDSESTTTTTAATATWNKPLKSMKYKKFVIVTARVHPGETSGSWMMEGFLKFITSDDPVAVDLRKRLVFKVIIMSNPDGVIVGNYRSSLAGCDLNRQFQNPDTRLHPTVVAQKELCGKILKKMKHLDEDPILSFIDMHGHSKKKNVFIYGPYYPLHNEKYLKMRLLPKLLSDMTPMFRFWSCKFRIEKSKQRAARLVLWREYNIMNCFTLEASFHGYINRDRDTKEFTTKEFMEMGESLGKCFHQFLVLVQEDERIKKQKEKEKRDKKKKKQQTTTQNKTEQGTKKKKNSKKTVQQSSDDVGYSNDTTEESNEEAPALDQANMQEELKIDEVMNPNEPSDNLLLLPPKPKSNSVNALQIMYKDLKKELQTFPDEEDQEQPIPEEKKEQGNYSGGSDSDPSGDDLREDDQDWLHSNIISVLEQYNIHKREKRKLIKKKKAINIAAVPEKPKKKKATPAPPPPPPPPQQAQPIKRKIVKSRLMTKTTVLKPIAEDKQTKKDSVMPPGTYYVLQGNETQNQRSAVGGTFENPLVINKIITNKDASEHLSKIQAQFDNQIQYERVVIQQKQLLCPEIQPIMQNQKIAAQQKISSILARTSPNKFPQNFHSVQNQIQNNHMFDSEENDDDIDIQSKTIAQDKVNVIQRGMHKRTSTTVTNNQILGAMNNEQLEEIANLMQGNNRRMKSLDQYIRKSQPINESFSQEEKHPISTKIEESLVQAQLVEFKTKPVVSTNLNININKNHLHRITSGGSPYKRASLMKNQAQEVLNNSPGKISRMNQKQKPQFEQQRNNIQETHLYFEQEGHQEQQQYQPSEQTFFSNQYTTNQDSHNQSLRSMTPLHRGGSAIVSGLKQTGNMTIGGAAVNPNQNPNLMASDLHQQTFAAAAPHPPPIEKKPQSMHQHTYSQPPIQTTTGNGNHSTKPSSHIQNLSQPQKFGSQFPASKSSNVFRMQKQKFQAQKRKQILSPKNGGGPGTAAAALLNAVDQSDRTRAPSNKKKEYNSQTAGKTSKLEEIHSQSTTYQDISQYNTAGTPKMQGRRQSQQDPKRKNTQAIHRSNEFDLEIVQNAVGTIKQNIQTKQRAHLEDALMIHQGQCTSTQFIPAAPITNGGGGVGVGGGVNNCSGAGGVQAQGMQTLYTNSFHPHLPKHQQTIHPRQINARYQSQLTSSGLAPNSVLYKQLKKGQQRKGYPGGIINTSANNMNSNKL